MNGKRNPVLLHVPTVSIVLPWLVHVHVTSAYTLARLPVAIDAPQRRRAAEALSEAQIAPL
eukprot:COSAG04_NODE_1938_length_5175_cov_178.678093_10_plen_61_part_00